MALLEVGRRRVLSPPETTSRKNLCHYEKLCLALHLQNRYQMQKALPEINGSSGICPPTDGTLREPADLSPLGSASPSVVVDREARSTGTSSVSHEMRSKKSPYVASNLLTAALAGSGLHLDNTPANVLSDAFPSRPVDQNAVDWGTLASNTAHARLSTDQESPVPHIYDYPVLRPVLPFIQSFLTIPMACSLLETYFSSTFDGVLHPACRHIHAFVFRRSSVLDRKNPRPCSAALLASMLCIAAETGCDEMLAWSHRRRQSVSSKLYTLTVQLLKPLVHVDYGYPEESRQNGGFPTQGRPTTGLARESQQHPADDASSLHEQGTIDDVVTYMHIAAVASASERKAASMRWWHAAFTLARELRLNLESPAKLAMFLQKGTESVPQSILASWADWDAFDFGALAMDFSDAAGGSPPGPSTEHPVLGDEQQEERRRTWWLLYIQDRYLALCYNRHLALTDAECSELLLPLDEAVWQSGSFLTSTDPLADRPGLPGSFSCTGHTVFGFLLPLMTIIGEIIDHNHGTQHPFLGEQYRMTPHAQAIEAQITQQLLTYKESLDTFQTRQPSPLGDLSADSQQWALHTRTVVGYADFVIQICYILLAGKCDPVSMLEDKDFWMLSPEFASTKDHAVKAAETLQQILDVDPDLSFMPYFMGILLLQGSFVLLLVIDRFQEQTEPRTVSACETVIRATEACVATLDSEYQVRRLHSTDNDRVTNALTAEIQADSTISCVASTGSQGVRESVAVSTTSGVGPLSLDTEWDGIGSMRMVLFNGAKVKNGSWRTCKGLRKG